MPDCVESLDLKLDCTATDGTNQDKRIRWKLGRLVRHRLHTVSLFIPPPRYAAQFRLPPLPAFAVCRRERAELV